MYAQFTSCVYWVTAEMLLKMNSIFKNLCHSFNDRKFLKQLWIAAFKSHIPISCFWKQKKWDKSHMFLRNVLASRFLYIKSSKRTAGKLIYVLGRGSFWNRLLLWNMYIRRKIKINLFMRLCQQKRFILDDIIELIKYYVPFFHINVLSFNSQNSLIQLHILSRFFRDIKHYWIL